MKDHTKSTPQYTYIGPTYIRAHMYTIHSCDIFYVSSPNLEGVPSLLSTYIHMPQEAALEAQRAEKEMHQKILRETADLTRAANVQHEASHSLVTHRQRSLEDKRMLAEEKKV